MLSTAAPRGTRLAAPLAVAVAGLTGCTLLLLSDPQDGAYPLCPFYALTGHWCPGCGSLRALARLVRLDLAGAAAFNFLLVIVLPYLVYRYGAWVLVRWTGRHLTVREPPPWAIWTLLAVVLAFGVLRNLPATPFSWLAPGT